MQGGGDMGALPDRLPGFQHVENDESPAEVRSRVEYRRCRRKSQHGRDDALDIVVLFSLILAVGMLVDDAIIVSEFAERRMSEGMKPQRGLRLRRERG